MRTRYYKTKIWVRILLVAAIAVIVFSYRSALRNIICARPKTEAPARIAPPESLLNLQNTFQEIAQHVKPAVVSITSVHMVEVPYQFYFGDPFGDFFEEFFGGTPGRQRSQRPHQRVEGMGSGVIINEDGYVLTNNHVIEGAQDINITMYNEEKYKGKVIGRDPRTDLAVIKIQSNKKFVSARLGDSDTIAVGDWAMAIGSPFGLEQTVTVGIISARRQALSVDQRVYRHLIQTDAAINRGNSGGPLVNLYGEVIGINTAIYAPTGVFNGIGFAIPVNRAKEIIGDLIEKGKVVRGYLGIEIAGIDRVMAEQFSLPEASGVLINRIMPDSAAERGGLKRGDVIVSFDKSAIRNPGDLQDIVSGTPIGKTVPVEVIRQGKKITVSVTIQEQPSADEIASAREETPDRDEVEHASWEGITVQQSSRTLNRRFGIPENENGVVVIDVDVRSKGAQTGIERGDLIKGINQKPVTDIKSFANITRPIDIKKGVMFDIIRQGRPIYITYQEG